MKQKSKTVLETLDPRGERTRAAIDGAFRSLISKRSYVRVRVGDIVRKAGVGRATFYAHYSSKDALLRAQVDRIVMPMIVQAPSAACSMDCTRLFAHVFQARDIYRSLTAGASRNLTERIIQDSLERRVAVLLTPPRRLSGASVGPWETFLPRFIASTLSTLLVWALEQKPAPTPSAVQEIFCTLIESSLGFERPTKSTCP